tara:strand:+ start:945 stop:1598 length:654 start_codon:yes stop_codon:yes gene_type:complete
MSSLKLKHSGGNSVSLNPPSSAPTSSDVAFKLPNADGSNGQYIKTDGSGNLAFASVTATSTRTCSSNTVLSSQANVDYTGFGTLKRFDIHVSALSTTGANWGVRLGTGGSLKTSGYNAGSGYIRSSSNVTSSTTAGFYTHGMNEAAYSNNGYFTFTKVSGTEHKWWCMANISEYETQDHWFVIFGYVTLSGTLDIISVLTESGTFDSGNLRLVTYSD